MSKQELKELERQIRDSLRKVRKEGKLSKEQEGQLKELESEGFSGKSEATGISFCEIISGRDSQQDAMFVGVLGDREAVNNPAEFYQGILTRMEEEHRECGNGTTICSAIVRPDVNGGLPRITTANLGDSRASLIIKYNKAPKGQKADYAYTSVSLTEDHGLEVSRCSDAVRKAGGKITECIEIMVKDPKGGDDKPLSIDLLDNEYGLKSRASYSEDHEFVEDVHAKFKKYGTISKIIPRNVRVNDVLKLAAAIGDGNFGIMRKPDIWEHNLAKIYQDLKINSDQVEDVDLVVACDGLWDATQNLHQYTSTNGKDRVFSSQGHYQGSLASKKANYDEFQKNKKSRFYGQSFAQFATYNSASEENQDNISVTHVPLITARTIIVENPIIATVCDGHGDSENISLDGNKATQDGALVSASVAAQLFVAAKVQSDMTITKTGSPHDYLQEFIEREKDLKHHLQWEEQENNRRRIVNDVNNILSIIPPSTDSLTANKTNSSSSPAVFDAKLEGISGTSKSTGISYREILGPRESQQDAMFVGTLGNAEAVKDTRKFYQDTINQMTQDHLQCNAGTTLCSAVVKPAAEDGGWPSVTTANLGDSRAALVIKYQVFKGDKAAIDAHGQPVYDFRTVSLTEDHSPGVSRCDKHVIDKGGYVKNGKVNSSLGVVGAFGDHDVVVIEEGDADCLLRTPDIWEYDLSKICKDLKIEASHVENIDLVVACDGVWDAIKNDYEYKANVNGQDKPDKMQEDSTKFQSRIIGGSAMSTLLNNNNLDPDQFAESLVTQALKANSYDNFSAITIPLVKGKKSKILEPIMATVCDGHGGLDNTPPETLKIASSKKVYDGALVSASVASQLFVAANVQKIADMSETKVGNPKDYLAEFLETEKRSANLVTSPSLTPFLQFQTNSMRENSLNNLKTSLKSKGWEEPSASVSDASAVPLSQVHTTSYAPTEIAESSYWSNKHQSHRSVADKDRGNKFKTIEGVYKNDGDIEKTMLDIIISVANSCSKKEGGEPISLREALATIEKAQSRGGLAHDKMKTEPAAEAWEKKFSKAFQSKCQECGILTGREDGANSNSVKAHVGLRMTYIPLSVTEKLRECVSAENNNARCDVKSYEKAANRNIEKIKDLVGEKIQMQKPTANAR